MKQLVILYIAYITGYIYLCYIISANLCHVQFQSYDMTRIYSDFGSAAVLDHIQVYVI